MNVYIDQVLCVDLAMRTASRLRMYTKGVFGYTNIKNDRLPGFQWWVWFPHAIEVEFSHKDINKSEKLIFRGIK